MNTILQKRIEEAAKKYADKIEEQNPNSEAYNIAGFFIAGATFALQNQWVSVGEGLPNADEEDKQYSVNVFARTKDCIRYAYYDFHNESWYSVEGGYRFSGDVTHWMSVPEIGGEK